MLKFLQRATPAEIPCLLNSLRQDWESESCSHAQALYRTLCFIDENACLGTTRSNPCYMKKDHFHINKLQLGDEMLSEMTRVNVEVCSKILNSVRVNAFHLQPVVCIGLARWLEQAGVGYFRVKASVTELLDSREDEILLLDIEAIHSLDAYSLQHLERCFAPRTIVVATCKQLERFGGQLPENIGSLVPPYGDSDDFIRAILAVTDHSTYIDPSLSATWDRVLEEPSFELTNRQLEILQLVADGKTSLQIAGLLGVRPKTVENHRAAIKERMGVVSAAEMVNVAHKRGICHPTLS